jgi:CheY-like chemotaxis protein
MAKILIIDDDPDIVKSMKIVLESKGYDVISAPSGKDGLTKVKESPPDLIILDIMMEVMDEGFDIARILKKSKDYKHIPILMLTAIKEKTGLGFKEEAGDELWLPVDDYCEKPLSPQELIEKVEKLLSQHFSG